MSLKTVFGMGLALITGCAASSHEVQNSKLGQHKSSADLVASLADPGIVELETVTAADWAVERSGLLNLSHPNAQDAGVVDGDEPIQIYFHAIHHPTRGLYIVDTGIERALRDAPDDAALSGMVRSAMHFEKLHIQVVLSEWLATQKKLNGVFLTHLHLDHVSGMRDVPHDTPVFSGPGEVGSTRFLHLFVRGSTDQALKDKGPLSEWQFQKDTSEAFEGIVDIFGDGSVWALWVPGHTPGSTAYLVRTTKGPVLLVGDASHTRWGWEHHVEPGSFTSDGPRSVQSFQRLKAFAAAHPEVEVRQGHQ